MATFSPVTAPLCTSAAALCLFMTGSPALADVTPARIWADWQTYFAASGYDITGQEALSGDTLTVSDITMVVDVPDEDATVTINFGEITFAGTGDGAVSVSWPDVSPIVIDVASEDGEDVQVRLDYLTRGLDMTASGDPEDITYAYTADSVAIEMRDLVVEGEATELGTVRFDMENVEGGGTTQTGDLRQSTQTLTAGPVSYTIDIVDPEGGEGRIVMNGRTASLALEGETAIPSDLDQSDMAAAIAQGFGAQGAVTYTDGTTQFAFTEEGDTVEGTSSSDSTDLRFAIGEEGLSYALGANGLAISMTGSGVPFPIEFAMAEMGFDFAVPVMAREASQDFGLGLRLADFTMSDAIWSIFDPQGQLPRDPATIAIDTTGRATLGANLLDEEAMTEVDDVDEFPGELEALDLNTLLLRAAGAELTGEGSFVFDNSDLETFDGLPAPDGSVDLRLQGANGLLDTLIAMGYLPQDQAMGVRMMMGMFAVPGDAEDVLKSTIEVKPDGRVLANGQRLR